MLTHRLSAFPGRLSGVFLTIKSETTHWPRVHPVNLVSSWGLENKTPEMTTRAAAAAVTTADGILIEWPADRELL